MSAPIFFGGIPEHLLRYVATYMVERMLYDRELLYDDTLKFIALVVKNLIYSVMHRPEGWEEIIGSMAAGKVMGKTTLIKEHGREFSTFVSSPTHLLQLRLRHFALLFEDPVFLRRLLMLIMQIGEKGWEVGVGDPFCYG